MSPSSSEPVPPAGNLLSQLVSTFRLPVALLVGAIAVAPNMVDVPLLDRWDVWGSVAIFGVFVVTAFCTDSRTILGVLTGVAVLALVIAELVLRLPDRSEKPAAQAQGSVQAQPSRFETRRLGAAPIETIHAFGRRWILHASGTIEGVDADGISEVTYHVGGSADALTACAGALVATHDHGKVARVDPISGNVLRDYRFGWRGGDVVCGGGFIWVTKRDRESVVQLDQRTLAYVDEFAVVGEATSITYGDGTIWILNGPARQIVGVIAATKEKRGPFAVMDDGQQILFVDDYIWVLHREASCLRRLDPRRGVETGPGIALGRYPYRIRHSNGVIYVPDYADDSILEIDASTVRPLGMPIALADGGRLVDADEYGGRLVALDKARSLLIVLRTSDRDTMRTRRAYDTTAQCPSAQQG